jgi:hypothetical protein
VDGDAGLGIHVDGFPAVTRGSPQLGAVGGLALSEQQVIWLALDLLVDSETAGCYKPEPRIFQRACDALLVSASEAVMVGDTPETGVWGPTRQVFGPCG